MLQSRELVIPSALLDPRMFGFSGSSTDSPLVRENFDNGRNADLQCAILTRYDFCFCWTCDRTAIGA